MKSYDAQKRPATPVKAVFPGKYIQGEMALLSLPELAAQFGKNPLLLGSPTIIKKILPDYFGKSDLSWARTEIFQGESSEKEIGRIRQIILEKQIDVLIGMGGGKTIDTAKIAADRTNIPVIIAPSIASTDAPTSGCAVIYSEDGVFEKVEYQKQNPQVVLMDLNIIAKAPVRFLVSGMGDALATWFEARSCVRTQSLNECGGLSTLTGLHLARLCYETLLKYGETAKLSCENQLVTPAFAHIVEANTLLSGLGFESSGIASAHAIHNGLTALSETHAFYHGEKVAFGLLSGLYLTDADSAEIDEVYTFCEKLGLPTTLSDLGLENVTAEKLLPAAEKTCEPGSFVYHEAGEINPEKVLQAMLLADAMGKKRKNRIERPALK
jgi:glycerol dehydrogenase